LLCRCWQSDTLSSIRACSAATPIATWLGLVVVGQAPLAIDDMFRALDFLEKGMPLT
jgi:hypothetical protein